MNLFLSTRVTAQRVTAFPLLILVMLFASIGHADEPAVEFYELRIYQIFDFEKQRIADQYLETALLPALNRQGVSNIGVFHDLKDENNHSIFVLIPWQNLQSMADSNAKLGKDSVYQEAAKPHTERPIKDSIFNRIDVRLMKAFDGMPTMELPPASKANSARIFELRLYESHTEEYARRKVAMFNEGEIDLMKEVELAPVFFAESIAGADMPNLIYMLSATDEESHQAHWKAFLASPKWEAMKVLPQYKDTVSKIKNWFLKPTAYSQQ